MPHCGVISEGFPAHVEHMVGFHRITITVEQLQAACWRAPSLPQRSPRGAALSPAHDAERCPTCSILLSVLRRSTLDIHEIERIAGITEGSCRRHLHHMKNASLVEELTIGTWKRLRVPKGSSEVRREET